MCLVLPVAGRKRIVARRDGVLAPNPAVAPMGAELAATLFSEHLPRGVLCIALRLVPARCPAGIVALVDPSTVLLENGTIACALPLGNDVVVLFNDSHSPERTRASLMEEYFHLRLGHRPTRIRVHDGRTRRSFSGDVETAAYHSGAAALVPYTGLRGAIEEGLPVEGIASRYQVSGALVEFRAKVTKLYRRLQQVK